MSKIVLPMLNTLLEEYDGDFNSYVENCLLRNIDINKIVENISFNGCHIKNVNFRKIYNCEIVDCLWENCDLANSSFENKAFYRVIFRDCNLVGVSFINCNFKNVIFDNCKGNYLNMANCKFKNVEIKNCCFREISFNCNKTDNIKFDGNDFTRGEIVSSKLGNVDFSSSVIDDIKIDMDSLIGIIINEYQALYLVSLLGVKIKD